MADVVLKNSCHVLFSTQSGRAKAGSRRVARILTENTGVRVLSNGSFDEIILSTIGNFCASIRATHSFLVLVVSTTGDGEHTDTIRSTWRQLLQRSLPRDMFKGIQFAIFSLGDRAYGPNFCAAGRKLAIRLLQLGATTLCDPGYGDDGTPNGGVFADFDLWIRDQFLPTFGSTNLVESGKSESLSYYHDVSFTEAERTGTIESEVDEFSAEYDKFFLDRKPLTSYSYHRKTLVKEENGSENRLQSGILAKVEVNDRITAVDWEQETRHIRLRVSSSEKHYNFSRDSLPYKAGDVVSVMPVNSDADVSRFLEVLPRQVREKADYRLSVKRNESESRSTFGVGYEKWPEDCTLRGWLTFCSDIQALPEREDLRALSKLCSLQHEHGHDQQKKLLSLSETDGAALYADYILREKRSWAEVLYDFDSLRTEGSKLGLSELFALLSPLRYRDFSIASSPTAEWMGHHNGRDDDDGTTRVSNGFCVELCVAKVEGTTPLGRTYHGLCSNFLSLRNPGGESSSTIRLWIKPGTFGGLPLTISAETGNLDTAVLYVGAGTGVAPLRGLIHERRAIQALSALSNEDSSSNNNTQNSSAEDCVVMDTLVFGCRKESKDFYYAQEWKSFTKERKLNLFTAFSRDQWHKIYVQQVLQKEVDVDLSFLASHVQANGAIYIAGGPLMARTVKEVIVESLAQSMGIEAAVATSLLAQMQRAGRFTVEAWS